MPIGCEETCALLLVRLLAQKLRSHASLLIVALALNKEYAWKVVAGTPLVSRSVETLPTWRPLMPVETYMPLSSSVL